MKKETYIIMTQPFRENAIAGRALHITNKIFTYIVMASYPLLLLYLLFSRDVNLFRAIVVPLDSFIILSVFRYMVNRPRPYEKFNIRPAIDKDTCGKSFPSRHVFSGFVISMTFLYCMPQVFPWNITGWVLMAVSAVIAIIRVISGVHYISDVLVGALVGIISGVVGFTII